MNSRRLIVASTLALTTMCGFALYCLASGPLVPPAVVAPTVKPKHVEIDLDQAMPLPIPTLKFELKATIFRTKDNKEGWAIRIPGSRPIATPAYSDGMIFVGGGYGSHEFYAFDAQTGALVWKYNTGDDGPTAAVVEDGFCAFNTESCTVYVLDAKSGKLVWQEWLGDPLMSQPAIYKGKLYIAYPGGQGGHQQAANNINVAAHAQSVAAHLQNAVAQNHVVSPPGHRMLCADLKTGKHLWDMPITADVISAPILDDGKVYFSCQDGTSFCMNADNGTEVWKKADGSTSAPVVAKGRLIVAQKEVKGKATLEKVAFVDANQYKTLASAAPVVAPYLQGATNGTIGSQSVAGMYGDEGATLDSTVGFGGGAPGSAQMAKASSNIAINTVAQGWAYQGSRSAIRKDKAFNAQGNSIQALKGDAMALDWAAVTKGKGISSSAQIFSPPSLGKENMYLASGRGHLLSIDQNDGKVNFMYSTDQPMVFQPALAGGNLYVGTSTGMVLCLKTGDKDADGWTAWGGNAQHNKKE